jgi:hypothetical protein
MRRHAHRRLCLAMICVATAPFVASPAPVQGAAGDPLFVFTPVPNSAQGAPIVPPPNGRLNGPCGLAVDSFGRFYVSDYYHHAVDVFRSNVTVGKPWEAYEAQVANVGPLDGPCGLALNSTNQLYVNDFHRNVVRYSAAPAPPISQSPLQTFGGSGTPLPLPSEDTAHHLPTGVAVDPATDNVYVDHRTYVSVFDSAGNPVLDGLEPLKIGLGTLGDGYGVAVSQFPGTLGRVYVPDAASNTVKVYDPATSKTTPVATIKNQLGQPFASLDDSAIAVDRVTGQIYFVDNTQPKFTEKPQASIYVYSSANAYNGRLKYNVTDALPVGLAIDNSALATQGRVYVTSGDSLNASVYVYGPGSAVFTQPLPPISSVALSTSGSGSGAITNSFNSLQCTSSCETETLSGHQITLTATPDPGSEFAGWSGGACTGVEPTCTLVLSEARSVGAQFVEESFSNQIPQTAPSPLVSPSGSQAQKPRAAQRRRHCRKAKKRCRRAKHHRIAKRR